MRGGRRTRCTYHRKVTRDLGWCDILTARKFSFTSFLHKAHRDAAALSDIADEDELCGRPCWIFPLDEGDLCVSALKRPSGCGVQSWNYAP